MGQTSFCGGCGETPGLDCCDSLTRAGVQKAHWECWSACNLRCGFCYRTMGRPLTTGEGVSLLRAIRTGGVSSVVFAGGDPSLRSDLVDLLMCARSLDLRTVIHTNVHRTNEAFWSAVSYCDHIGLSVDGPNAEVHDTLRGRTGNFSKVLAALRRCSSNNIPVSVRTVVTATNIAEVPAIGRVLERYGCVKSWKLLEFSAVENGYLERDVYAVRTAAFDEVYQTCREAYASLNVESLSTVEKVGAYMMISPNGGVYGVTQNESIDRGRHRLIGTILRDHLSYLAGELHIDPKRHAKHLRILADC